MTYTEWIARYDTLTPQRRMHLQQSLKQLGRLPLISILLPVYNPDFRFLAEAIASARQQIYPNWELCIADDASTNLEVHSFLEAQRVTDPRIKPIFRETNGHISAATNSALTLATGDWCALLDQDDILAENALAEVAREAVFHPNSGVIYSDEDFIDSCGVRTNPFFKPDWNAELFLGQNYLNHLGVYRTDILRKIGGFREGFEGSQDYDVALRCVALLQAEQIRHVPRILYHWRMTEGSLASEPDAKPYAREAARRALNSYCQDLNLPAHALACPENDESHRVVFSLPAPLPRVTVITSSHDVTDWITATDYSSLELIFSEPNAKQLNETARRSHADILVFLNGLVRADEPGWLHELVSHSVRPEVGVVGGRIWSEQGHLEVGALVLGLGGIASPAFGGIPRGHPGYFNRAWLQQSCSAVSIACLGVRREVFQRMNGFDEINLSNHFYDVDFCLRVRRSGLQVNWTPYANLVAGNKALRSSVSVVAELSYMQNQWGENLRNDPYYSPNLSLELPGFSLADPPRLGENGWEDRYD